VLGHVFISLKILNNILYAWWNTAIEADNNKQEYTNNHTSALLLAIEQFIQARRMSDEIETKKGAEAAFV
jgi:hypothetical protein